MPPKSDAPADGIVLNLHEMIDLSIGTPEVGVVDFCMLQAVLHCVVQQLRIQGKNVELKGNVGVLPVGRSQEGSQTLAIHEFELETDGVPAETADGVRDTILVVERVLRGPGGAGPFASGPVRSDRARASGGTRGDGSDTKAGGGGGTEGGARSGTAVTGPSKTKSSGKKAKAKKADTESDDESDESDAKPAAAAPKAPSAPAAKAASPPAAKTPSPPANTTPSKPASATPSAPAPASPPASAPAAPPAAASASPQAPASAASGPTVAPTPPASLVTLSKFNLLESTVNDLKDRVYGSIPKNETILEEVRSQTNIKAITDMWTNLNVSSRLEAAEAGIQKLSSLLQDVITSKGESGSAPATAPAPAAAPPAAPAPAPAAPAAPAAAGAAAVPDDVMKNLTTCVTDVEALKNNVNELKTDHERLNHSFQETVKEIYKQISASTGTPAIAPPVIGGPPAAPSPGGAPPVEETPVLAPALDLAFGAQNTISTPIIPQAMAGPDSGLSSQIGILNSKLDNLEGKLSQLCAVVFNPNLGSLQDQITSLQDQLELFGSPAGGGGMPTPDGGAGGGIGQDLQGLMKQFQKVQGMQEQLQQVHDTARQLVAEREEKQQNLKSLLEQIELLKTIKLDREDMVEALADKADLRLLARKVSHDQFEMACDDLSKGLEHALGKLTVQEAIWQQALDDIQREFSTKLDKLELLPVKEFFNSKLKQLQENLKQMADLRREVQAAGTKKKLLMDVNCISCDANAVMNAEHAVTGGGPKALQAHLSMKPYLCYELDTIRKAQQSNVPQRNLHDWENMTKSQPPAKPPQKVRSETDKHMCNRYCGGSHTTTTAAQRVARLGHFIKQWGPEVLPLSSDMATGDDGRMYKVTTSQPPQAGPGGAADVPCTPRKGSPKDQPKAKSSNLAPECRCLEDRLGK